MNTKKKEITIESDEGYSIRIFRFFEDGGSTVSVVYDDENFSREITLGDTGAAKEVAQAILEICK
jgi:hypothetical protein